MREGEIPVFYGEITNEGRQLPPFGDHFKFCVNVKN